MVANIVAMSNQCPHHNVSTVDNRLIACNTQS